MIVCNYICKSTMKTYRSFAGRHARIGNSSGLRLEKAFFDENPEFARGNVRVQALAPGVALVRAEYRARRKAATRLEDPALVPFLALIDRRMASHPEELTAYSAREAAENAALVRGVKLDP